ncbi:MAG: 50S ribosomal protein L25/general stress protein Ctc [Alphaproteobacteria bacterium]|nr:50S ribosomal protein L25/general stress protein Ctc [Alphaproteobacteria bacterium]
MQKQTLSVSLRQKGGKGASRELRRQEQIPAIVYGDKKDPCSVTICPKAFLKEMHKAGFSSRIFELEGDNVKEKCLCKNVQFDPVSDRMLHVDFLRVNDKKAIKLNIPLNFVGREKSPGLKQGGILNTLRREVEVLCLPKDIPEEIEVNLEGLVFGDTIHALDLKLPEDVSLADENPEYSICVIVSPRVAESTDSESTDTEATDAEPAEATEEKANESE